MKEYKYLKDENLNARLDRLNSIIELCKDDTKSDSAKMKLLFFIKEKHNLANEMKDNKKETVLKVNGVTVHIGDKLDIYDPWCQRTARLEVVSVRETVKSYMMEYKRPDGIIIKDRLSKRFEETKTYKVTLVK